MKSSERKISQCILPEKYLTEIFDFNKIKKIYNIVIDWLEFDETFANICDI